MNLEAFFGYVNVEYIITGVLYPWGIGSKTPIDTKIWGCSSPLWKWRSTDASVSSFCISGFKRQQPRWLTLQIPNSWILKEGSAALNLRAGCVPPVICKLFWVHGLHSGFVWCCLHFSTLPLFLLRNCLLPILTACSYWGSTSLVKILTSSLHHSNSQVSKFWWFIILHSSNYNGSSIG